MKILKCGEKGWKDFAFYWSDKYLGFNFPLHYGWQSSPHFIKGGWEYYEAAILYGNKTTGHSKWYKLPKVILPAKLVHVWRMRKNAYRYAYREDSVLLPFQPTKETEQ